MKQATPQRPLDAQVTDLATEGPLADGAHRDYHGIPPVKPAPFEAVYIPTYFWLGGVAAGAWLAATAEDLAGEDDRGVVRAGRYLTLASVAGGTGLLIADLGRPERFLNMLRIFRARSAMSLGAWALTSFGAYAGMAATLQAAEDGLLGERPALARLSSGQLGRLVHLLGLPAALFVGSYTGVLLSSTSTPSWAARTGVLSPLFAASAVSSGLAAVTAVLYLTGEPAPRTVGRLARAHAVAAAAEAGLHIADRRQARRLPSHAQASTPRRLAELATFAAGMLAPVALAGLEAWAAAREDRSERARNGRGDGGRRGSPGEAGNRAARGRGRVRHRRAEGGGPHAAADPAPGKRGRRDAGGSVREDGGGSLARRLGLTAAALSLAGSLALRFLTVAEGEHSARTPQDTWAYAGEGDGRGGADGGRLRAGEPAAGQPASAPGTGGAATGGWLPTRGASGSPANAQKED